MKGSKPQNRVRISFIIPACNEEDYLPSTIRCLRELQEEEFSDIEIIVIVNGSTDQTLELAQELADKVILDHEHRGVSRARNLGAFGAHGDILVFLDADTRPLAGSLQAIDEAMKSPQIIGTCAAKPDQNDLKARIWVSIKNVVRSSGINKGASELIFCHRSLFSDHGIQFDQHLNIGEICDFFSRAEKQANTKYVYLREAPYLTCMRRQRKIGYFKNFLFWLRSWIFTRAFKRNLSTFEAQYWSERY